MKFVKASPILLTFAGLTSCTDAPPSSPMCRIAKGETFSLPANAGCIIKVNKHILAITHLFSNKFDIPGGTASDTDGSAQCTAHRETWEETGFNVEVGPLLGVSSSGFHFYACELDDDFDGLIQQFPVPDWSQTEVTSIELINPFSSAPAEWRFPEELIEIRGMFNQLGKIQKDKAALSKNRQDAIQDTLSR